MESLRAYLKTLTPEGQRDYAVASGTTIGYLRKALSTREVLREKLCAQLEVNSAGAVTRRNLRPHDWAVCWPELAESQPQQAPAAIKAEANEDAHG